MLVAHTPLSCVAVVREPADGHHHGTPYLLHGIGRRQADGLRARVAEPRVPLRVAAPTHPCAVTPRGPLRQLQLAHHLRHQVS